MNFTKIDQGDLDLSRQELSNGGLGFVVAPAFFLGINFVCVYFGRAIQL